MKNESFRTIENSASALLNSEEETHNFSEIMNNNVHSYYNALCTGQTTRNFQTRYKEYIISYTNN